MELDIPEPLVDRVQDVYRRAGYASASAFVADAIRHRLDELGHEKPSMQPGREELLRKAKGFVPQSDEREHLPTGEPLTADTELEARFVAMVIDTHGQTKPKRAHRWTSADISLAPDERDLSMEQWTALSYKAGNVTSGDLDRWNLPTEWIERPD